MKKTFWFTMCVVSVLASPMAAADDNQLDTIYNEEAIIAQLAEVDPAVGYLARLKMMKAHLKASLFTLNAGDAKEALEHVGHPRTEILAELEAGLKERGITDLLPALERAEKAFHGGNVTVANNAVESALAVITKAESLAGSTKSNAEIAPDVIATLLRMAVVEYHEAFEYQKLTNKVEYHDGAFFVREARLMLEELAPDYKAKDAKAYDKMISSLETLYKAWPENTPPDTAILPATKMQTLVSIAEIQLNRLR